MTELERYQDPLTIQRVLHSARTIAIVGLSSNPLRASNFVGFYLKRHGYRVIPVNPRETEILGEVSYPSLLGCACAGGRRQRLPRSGCAAGDRAGGRRDQRRRALVPVRRDQRGGRTDRRGGRRDVIMDRCLKVEHARYVGRMHWLGFNTQRITSVRGALER